MLGSSSDKIRSSTSRCVARKSRSFSLPALAFDATIWESLATGIAIASTSNVRRADQTVSKSNPLITHDRSTSVPIPSLARVSRRRSTTARASAASRSSSSGSAPGEQLESAAPAHTPRNEQVPGVRGQEEVTIERHQHRTAGRRIVVRAPHADDHVPYALRREGAGKRSEPIHGLTAPLRRTQVAYRVGVRAVNPALVGTGRVVSNSFETKDAPEVVGCKRDFIGRIVRSICRSGPYLRRIFRHCSLAHRTPLSRSSEEKEGLVRSLRTMLHGVEG